ncbi:MAG: T9SS type A sorting domain-containing protein [Bacteroidota bacterium]
MRKYLIILTTLIIISKVSIGQTNVYHPFPDSSGIWNEHYVSTSGNGYYSYAIFGDTVINSLNYHKLYRHNLNLSFSDTVMIQNNSEFIGAIREDNSKKIFYYNKYMNSCCAIADSVYLLYDFSMLAGDTIHGFNYPDLVLDSIDSVLVNNQYRKRFNLRGDTWIEGIGSTRDLLSTILAMPTCYCVNEIVCYKYGDTTCYLNTKFHDCFPFLGVNSDNLFSQKIISISPNPVASQALLQSDIMLKEATLVFYNSLGQAVKQIENISAQSIVFSRDNLTNGLYFIRITQDNKLFTTEKIVITDN